MTSETQRAWRIADLILRYRENTLSPDETEELEEWLKESPEHREQLENLNTRAFLQQKYRLEQTIDTAAAYAAFSRRIAKERPRKLRKWFAWTAVAALFAVIVGIYWFWPATVSREPLAQNPFIPAGGNEAVLTLANGERLHLQGATTTSIRQDDGSVAEVSSASLAYKNNASLSDTLLYNSLHIPRKGEFNLVLSDGTQIWLNSESTVRYPTNFLPGQRKIQLRGEAYLEVAPDRTSPFVIETGKARIEVLGTSFNLRAYEDEQIIQTTLAEGRVCVTTGTQRMELVPGEQGCVDAKTGNMVKKVVDVRIYTAWKDGRFVFEGQTLEEIMRTLARWYDVEVVFSSDKTRNIKFTGNLKRYDDFGQIVSMLELACPAKFLISGTTISISE